MKKLVCMLMAAAMLVTLCACGDEVKNTTKSQAPAAAPEATKTEEAIDMNNGEYPFEIIETKDPISATMEVETYGTIELELYPDIAPISVSNFVYLANKGYYDGLTFHRIIEGFMIQGGCPLGTGTGDPGYKIKGEFSANGVENNLAHTKGVLSMARAQAPDSAGSQFFIMHEDAPHLDGQYAAFGKVIDGIEIVDKIATVETDYSDRPVTPVVIKSVKVEQ